MWKRASIAGLLALALGGAGFGRSSCVQFDGQSVVARRSAEHDRLDLLLIYRDLHLTGDPAKGLEQLEKIRAGARWFAFIANFPFMLNLDELATQERRADRPATAACLDALVAHTTVRSGPLWTDDQGRLCGSQLLRLDELGATLRAANAALREKLSVQGGLERFAREWSVGDAETLRLLREAVDGQFEFIGLRGSAPCFTLPISDAGFVQLKRAALESTWEGIAKSAASAQEQLGSHAVLEALALNEWAIERAPGQVRLVLGDPRAAGIELTAPPTGLARPDAPHTLSRRALVDALTPRGWTIVTTDGEAAARAGFEAFAREP